MRSPDSSLASRTTTQLLEALRDPSDRPAWEHLDRRFRPVIAGFTRRLGLTESEAEEAAQQTLYEFARAYRDGRYERERGRLSSWILGIAHHTALRTLRDRRRAASLDEDQADESALRSIWSEERDRVILMQALGKLRDDSSIDDRTLLVFELTALRGVPTGEAAAQAGMTADQVYVARSRLVKRLREAVAVMTGAFEEDC